MAQCGWPQVCHSPNKLLPLYVQAVAESKGLLFCVLVASEIVLKDGEGEESSCLMQLFVFILVM